MYVEIALPGGSLKVLDLLPHVFDPTVKVTSQLFMLSCQMSLKWHHDSLLCL